MSKQQQQQTPPLERKIAEALADTNIGSIALADLMVECEKAIAAADQAAARTREESLDPALSPDLKEARERMEDATFAANRLRTLQPRLDRRVQEVTQREECDQWRERYDKLKPQRDALAAELKEAYAAIPQLVDVLKKVAALSSTINKLHNDRPHSENLYLNGVEQVARGFDDYSGVPSIANNLVLLDFVTGSTVWPPKAEIDPTLFAPQPYDRRYSGDWWRDHADAAEQKRQEQQRLLVEEAEQRKQFWRPRA